MLKRFLTFLDVLLPAHFSEAMEAPVLYRGRMIVATNIVSLVACIFLLLAVVVLNLSLFAICSIILVTTILLFRLYFFKNVVSNFEKNLLVGAGVQTFVITVLVYLTSFSPRGMGFFGLIWLIPLFLMIAFYFNTRFSFYFSVANLILFFIISSIRYEHFYDPIHIKPHFPITFLIHLSTVIVFCYLMAFLFVRLSEDLQKEVAKQRDLLAESAKFQSLGRMASNLAHDINNPLFSIQGKLHQMRNLLSRDQLDLQICDQIVESVEATILKMSQMVKGISTFAREGRGDQMISIGVEELIQSNLVLAIDRIKNSGIELETQIDPKAQVICYPSFISQVLLNLLNNSIDALEHSVVKKIEVKAFIESSWVNIEISDTGAGIPKDIECKIFDPFFTTKTFGKGTGLGLSISKGLIEVHEGELQYLRIGERTIFKARLPSYE